MNLTDALVLSAIAAAASFPLLRQAVTVAVARLRRSNVSSPDAIEQWRQRWTALLITLGREIEAGSGSLTRQQEALRLSRELMWEIIGGDPDQPSKK